MVKFNYIFTLSFVSDIAVFVLKRDVKLQPINSAKSIRLPPFAS